MRERDFHLKLAKKFGSEVHWEKYKTIRNKVNSVIRKAKANVFKNKFSECSQQRNVNTLLGKDGSKSTIVNELNIDGSVITDGVSIANQLNNYFVQRLK